MRGLPSASRPWEENGFPLCVEQKDRGWLGLGLGLAGYGWRWLELALAVAMIHFACQKSSARGAELAGRASRRRGLLMVVWGAFERQTILRGKDGGGNAM